MSDMPEFRSWADRAHRNSLRLKKNKKKPTRYKCINPACNYGTVASTAKATYGQCARCGSDLIQKAKFNG